MKTQPMLLAALASAPAALAHTVFTNFFVDGMLQGIGVAMRMNPNAAKASSPIPNLDSEDTACNVGGTTGVSRVQPVKDGAVLTFTIRAFPKDPAGQSIARNHKGPCAVYLKKVSDASTDRAAGPGWFKIFEYGYNNSTNRWCTDEIIDNHGLFNVKLPLGLLGGDYLVRPEIIALHAARDHDPQLYTGCAQIFLESSGNLVPASTVPIPGYITYNQPSTNFNIYHIPNNKYVMPGPKVAKLTPGGTQKASTTQTHGLKPEGCIVENANWCGKEVPSYDTEKGCWASAQNCWDQSDVCFNTCPPTGNAGCKIWQDKCKDINAKCTAMNFKGPPNKDKILTPKKKSIDVGKILQNVGGGIVDAVATKPAADDQYVNSPIVESPVAPPAPEPTVDDQYESPPIIEASATPVVEPSTPSPPTRTPTKPCTFSQVPVSTITVGPSSAYGPAPTEVPCPKGWRCVIVTEVDVVTTTVLVTASAY